MQIIAPKKQWFTKSHKQKKSADAKWKRFRVHVLKTYGHQCMACDATEGVMHIDHIKPKSVYRSLWYDITNVQVLCQTCNLKKRRDTKDYRLDWAMRNQSNPHAKSFMKRLGAVVSSSFDGSNAKGGRNTLRAHDVRVRGR